MRLRIEAFNDVRILDVTPGSRWSAYGQSAPFRLAESFLICSHCGMDRERLSSILLNAPAWVRLGLAVLDARLRERAADALAATIVDKLEEPESVVDRSQLGLPL